MTMRGLASSLRVRDQASTCIIASSRSSAGLAFRPAARAALANSTMPREPAERREIALRVFRLQHTADEIERLGRTLLEIGEGARQRVRRMRIVPAVEPHFRSLRHQRYEWAFAQALQARRPFDMAQALLHCVLAAPAFSGMPQPGDGSRRVLDLVWPGKTRQWQVEQRIAVLIDHAAMLGMREEILTREQHWRFQRLGAALDHVMRDIILWPDDHRHARLDDAGFLRCDPGQGRSEKFLMIQADRRDDGHRRFCDHIRRVVFAAEPYFQHQRIRRMTGEGEKCSGCRDFKESNGLARVGALAIVQGRGEFVLADDSARKPDAFVEVDKMRRRIDVHLQTLRFEDRATECAGRAFAVRSRHMDDRRHFPLGMTKRREQPLDAIQNQVDALGMECQKPFENGITALGSNAHGAAPAGFATGGAIEDRTALPVITGGVARERGRERFMSKCTRRDSVVRKSWRWTTISTIP